MSYLGVQLTSQNLAKGGQTPQTLQPFVTQQSQQVFFFTIQAKKWLWKIPGFPTVGSAGWFRSNFRRRFSTELPGRCRWYRTPDEMEECFGEGQGVFRWKHYYISYISVFWFGGEAD